MLSKSRFPKEGEQPPPVARGPFFIVLLMMPAFLFLIFLLLMVMQYKQLRSFVSEKAMPIDVVPVSMEVQAQTLAKVRFFFSDSAADTLSMTAEELNHFVRTSNSLKELNFDYHFEMEDTLIVARNSLPVTSMHGLPALLAKVTGIRGYLNSVMKGYPELKEGRISMIPVFAEMNGVPAPASVLTFKGTIDIGEWVADKAFYDQAIAVLAEVKIRAGRLLLIKRS